MRVTDIERQIAKLRKKRSEGSIFDRTETARQELEIWQKDHDEMPWTRFEFVEEDLNAHHDTVRHKLAHALKRLKDHGCY